MTILGRSEELVSRCVECDLAEPESLASLGGSAPGVVDGILSLSEERVFSSGVRMEAKNTATSRAISSARTKPPPSSPGDTVASPMSLRTGRSTSGPPNPVAQAW